jgi:hypothetical protein
MPAATGQRLVLRTHSAVCGPVVTQLARRGTRGTHGLLLVGQRLCGVAQRFVGGALRGSAVCSAMVLELVVGAGALCVPYIVGLDARDPSLRPPLSHPHPHIPSLTTARRPPTVFSRAVWCARTALRADSSACPH